MNTPTANVSPTTLEARAWIAARLGSQLAPLRQLSLRKRLVELAVFGLLAAAGIVLTLVALVRLQGLAAVALHLVATLLTAIAFNAFVLLLHEGMHGVLFRNRWLNRWASVALGAPCLISFSAYRVMHTLHHDHLGDPLDPDDYANYTSNRRLVWLMHFTRLLCASFVYILIIPFLSYRHGNAAERRAIVEEYLVLALLAVVALALLPWPMLLHVWLLPVIVVGYMVNIRGFTQHGITEAHDAFLASRSMELHPLLAYCLLNENYHLEHHLFPEVPSYHLGDLHRLMWLHLPRAVVGTSYLGFLGEFLHAARTLDETPIGLTMLGDERTA
ncbi:MAG: fatty acid desaturase [Chloroflexaceae bacterium]|jgi:fatty acid desaturase|nr:fatty acid desaturase [Chloroflexaceae bacterium]